MHGKQGFLFNFIRFPHAMFLIQEPHGKKSNPKDSDNVRVVVRCRPMNDTEKTTGCKQCVKVGFCLLASELLYLCKVPVIKCKTADVVLIKYQLSHKNMILT